MAVRYLHDTLGLDQDRLVYAGDSGNDRAAMLSGFNVIVVANALDTLKATIREQAETLGLDHRIYFAKTPYAHGVLEGCRRFGIL